MFRSHPRLVALIDKTNSALYCVPDALYSLESNLGRVIKLISRRMKKGTRSLLSCYRKCDFRAV